MPTVLRVVEHSILNGSDICTLARYSSDLDPTILHLVVKGFNVETANDRVRYRDMYQQKFENIGLRKSPIGEIHRYLKENGFAYNYNGDIVLTSGIKLRIESASGAISANSYLVNVPAAFGKL